MHGRVKTVHSAAEVAAEREKIQKANLLYSTILKRDLPLEKALDVTVKALMLNPEFATLWNMRRELILRLAGEDSPAAEQDEGGTAAAPGDHDDVRGGSSGSSAADRRLSRRNVLEQELKLINKAMTQTQKSYCLWHHRKWTVAQLLRSRRGASCDELLNGERAQIDLLFSVDDRNFHCWAYRDFVQKLKMASAVAPDGLASLLEVCQSASPEQSPHWDYARFMAGLAALPRSTKGRAAPISKDHDPSSSSEAADSPAAALHPDEAEHKGLPPASPDSGDSSVPPRPEGSVETKTTAASPVAPAPGPEPAAPDRSEVFPHEDEDFSRALVTENFSNWSAWHLRTRCVDRANSHTRNAELELVEAALYTEPQDSSVWDYYSWLTRGSSSGVRVAECRYANDQLFVRLSRNVRVGGGVVVRRAGGGGPSGEVRTSAGHVVAGQAMAAAEVRNRVFGGRGVGGVASVFRFDLRELETIDLGALELCVEQPTPTRCSSNNAPLVVPLRQLIAAPGDTSNAAMDSTPAHDRLPPHALLAEIARLDRLLEAEPTAHLALEAKAKLLEDLVLHPDRADRLASAEEASATYGTDNQTYLAQLEKLYLDLADLDPVRAGKYVGDLNRVRLEACLEVFSYQEQQQEQQLNKTTLNLSGMAFLELDCFSLIGSGLKKLDLSDNEDLQSVKHLCFVDSLREVRVANTPRLLSLELPDGCALLRL